MTAESQAVLDVELAKAPENEVVQWLRHAVKPVAVIDILIVALALTKLVSAVFFKSLALWILSHAGLMEGIPALGVSLTNFIIIMLVTARLSSLESDQSDLVLIQDDEVKAERANFLDSQIRICTQQRRVALMLLGAYMVLMLILRSANADINNGLWQLFFVAVYGAEVYMPIINIRGSTIVEASLQKIDVIRDTIYQSQMATQRIIAGVALRSRAGALTHDDYRVLRHSRAGKIDRVLTPRTQHHDKPLEGVTYTSLRSIITGVADDRTLTPEQQWRYNRAKAIARTWRESEDEQVRRHFQNGPNNLVMVTEEMAGRIAKRIAGARRRPRNVKPAQTQEETPVQEPASA